MTIDLGALNELRRTYQARSEDVGQAYAEAWGDLDGVEVIAREAGEKWLVAVHAAWPEIASLLAARENIEEQ